jgi:hypothetical protein
MKVTMTGDQTTLQPEDRWACPLTWLEWSDLLMREMDLHDWPFGRDIDPEDYREFFVDGVDPHTAIEEAFNDGI